MPIEHEAKVLGIDPETIIDQILVKGGQVTGAPRLMQRYVYDIVPGDHSRWIRLCRAGTETTLCVKGEPADELHSGRREARNRRVADCAVAEGRRFSGSARRLGEGTRFPLAERLRPSVRYLRELDLVYTLPQRGTFVR